MFLSDQIEKSACGVGFLASRKGISNHALLQQVLHALRCVEHRGACAADHTTGDGAGIMTDIPFSMFGYEKGAVAVATLFTPTNLPRQRVSRSTDPDRHLRQRGSKNTSRDFTRFY